MNQPETIACWSCKGPVTIQLNFCRTCNAIQPPREYNPFQLFELSPTFDVDNMVLENKYLNLQQKLHPDLFVSKSNREKDYAMQCAANLNDAYLKLKSPVKRAEILLFLNGIEASSSEDKSINDTEILMEAIEMREALLSADSANAVDSVMRESLVEMDDCILEISKAFNSNNLSIIEKLIARLKYLEKFVADARERQLLLKI